MFRLFAEHVRQLFMPYHAQWVKRRKKQDLSDALLEFAASTFPAAMQEPASQKPFMLALVSVVHSNRLNREIKAEKISRRKEDFTEVMAVTRNVLYCYSRKAH